MRVDINKTEKLEVLKKIKSSEFTIKEQTSKSSTNRLFREIKLKMITSRFVSEFRKRLAQKKEKMNQELIDNKNKNLNAINENDNVVSFSNNYRNLKSLLRTSKEP